MGRPFNGLFPGINGGGRSSYGVRLSGLQSPIQVVTGSALYGESLVINNVNISPALTQMCSVNVPSGKVMILLDIAITSAGSSGNNFQAELEIDGEVKLTSSLTATSISAFNLVGGLSTAVDVVRDLEVHGNFKVRARRQTATAATISIKYILVEA